MAKPASDFRREAQENRERLEQLLRDLQATLPIMDDGRVARLLPALREAGVPGIVGIHRTFLDQGTDGGPPVRLAKKMLGSVRGGAVRLVPAAEHMGIAEGIETALSVMAAVGLPVWACLSSSGLEDDGGMTPCAMGSSSPTGTCPETAGGMGGGARRLMGRESGAVPSL